MTAARRSCARPRRLRAAMSIRGSYLLKGDRRDALDVTPDSSRRARALDVWAALRCLGRSGVCRARRPQLQAGRLACTKTGRHQCQRSQRGGPQPGRRGVRRRRCDQTCHRLPTGRWRVLVRRHQLAGPRGHAHQRKFLGDHAIGYGAQPRRDPPGDGCSRRAVSPDRPRPSAADRQTRSSSKRRTMRP